MICSEIFEGASFGGEIEPGTFHGGEIEPGTFHGGEMEPGTFHHLDHLDLPGPKDALKKDKGNREEDGASDESPKDTDPQEGASD
jgi:hypothetical protein